GDCLGGACAAAVATSRCYLVFATAEPKAVKANYAGDSNFNASTSAGVTHNVTDFSISATPTSQTIKAGQRTNYKVTLTPLNGFGGTISLSCTGLPSGSTCSFASASITLSGSSSASSAVTVQTSTRTATGT